MHDSVEGHKRMHKRARATTSTNPASATTSTTGKRVRTSNTATSLSTNTAFQPGAAASGTATRTVPNGPPTHSGISSIDDSFYSSWSFANKGTGLSLASGAPATTAGSGGVAAAAGGGGVGKAGSSAGGEGMQLSQGALIGIIAGGAAAGVALLALIGWCCWKRKKEKKDEGGWWSLDDDPAKGAVKNVNQNQQGGGAISREINNRGMDPWESTESFSPGPPQSEKWSRFDEKQQSPSFQQQPRDLQSQRNELFAPPSSNSRTLTPSPSASTLPSTHQPPRAPFAQAQTGVRPETGAYSVNDVISFSGGPRQNAQYPPVSSVYPASTVEYPRSVTATPPPPSGPSSRSPLPQQQQSSVTMGPQPVTAPSYPPQRPPRPSEVPSAPPSPYNYVKKAERPTSRDEGIAHRFMDVMTGKVGKEDEDDEKEEIKDEETDQRRKKRQSVKPTASSSKNKKDTIMGLTDAYAGGGEEEWARVEIDTTARRSTLQRNPSKRSQRTVDSPTKPGFPPLPTNPSKNPSHNSSRIDSKPLKELESYFGSFALPSRNPRALSGVSEMTTAGETSYSYGPRTSIASSHTPQSGFSRQQSFGTPNGGNHVHASESQASLSPLVAPQAGRPGAYGELTNNALSIYSAAGEVSEMSSGGSSSGSPAKSRFGAGGLGVSTSSGSIGTLSGPTPAARSPLAGGGKEEEGDVFGPASNSHPLAVPNASTEQPSYSLSTAEQDILNQLGLATPSSSGERTPDLSLSSIHRFEDSDHRSDGSLSSSSGSGGLVTPSTPQFPSPPSSNVQIVQSSPSPNTLELKPPPTSKLRVPPSSSPHLDLAANGFVPLAEMSKKIDPQYRSATMSLYELYD
ncbi:uncharacterized protein JCM6883_004945 [Sporobolomyces salmoneus]|uniref:uncharacterized protein n=1 Tax=Sporobolomyces salmoneus TaxID=183962 RepID=UPI0031716EF3